MTDYSFWLERDLMIVLGTGRRNVAWTPIATYRGGSVSHVILGLKITTPMFSSQLFFNWKFSNLQKSWRTSTVNTCIPLIFSLIHKLLAFCPICMLPSLSLSLHIHTHTHFSFAEPFKSKFEVSWHFIPHLHCICFSCFSSRHGYSPT